MLTVATNTEGIANSEGAETCESVILSISTVNFTNDTELLTANPSTALTVRTLKAVHSLNSTEKSFAPPIALLDTLD